MYSVYHMPWDRDPLLSCLGCGNRYQQYIDIPSYPELDSRYIEQFLGLRSTLLTYT